MPDCRPPKHVTCSAHVFAERTSRRSRTSAGSKLTRSSGSLGFHCSSRLRSNNKNHPRADELGVFPHNPEY